MNFQSNLGEKKVNVLLVSTELKQNGKGINCINSVIHVTP